MSKRILVVEDREDDRPLATSRHVAIAIANGGGTDIGQCTQNVVPDP